ncbi:MAG: ATP synthase F1 subunit delta [Vampirovibrio sp.]|nr:ATP synthase F1 subunit delta [Vampirovibrio sp.]
MMMSSSTANTTFSAVAKQYANTLYELATEQGSLKTLMVLVPILSQVIEKTPELHAYLANQTLTAEKRAAMLFDLLPSDSPPLLAYFLTLVIENHRQDDLLEILHCFNAKANELAGIGLIEITTAFALTNALRESLGEALRIRFSLKGLNVTETIDPSLKAGLVLTYNGQRLDATLQTRMAQLKHSLQQI